MCVQSNFEDTRTIVKPWTALDMQNKYQLVLDEEVPVNGINPVSLQVITDGAGATAGVVNPGYWGINVSTGLQFTGSVYLRSDTIKSVTVALFNGTTVYAEATIDGVMPMWMKFNFSLTTQQAGTAAFRMTWKTTGKADRLNIDVVTLFPVLGWKGLPWLRPDLAQAVADLHPSFMRFPGGCFVEGQIIANRFNWYLTRALAHSHSNTGHAGGVRSSCLTCACALAVLRVTGRRRWVRSSTARATGTCGATGPRTAWACSSTCSSSSA